MNDERNKLIIPKKEPKVSGCPKCGAYDFSGRRINGMVLRKCRKCGNEWAGGLPQLPQDPRIPVPAESHTPTVQFSKNVKVVNGERIETVEEVRRRPDPTQSFRKGAKIPNEGEE